MRNLPYLLLLLVGCHPAPASAPAGPAAGTVEPGASPLTMRSRALGETRHINIYTPPGYAESGERYPVLYMPDGGVEEDLPHVTEDIAAAVRAG